MSTLLLAHQTHGGQPRYGSCTRRATDDELIVTGLAFQQGEMKATLAVLALRLGHHLGCGELKVVGLEMAAMWAFNVERGVEQLPEDVHGKALSGWRQGILSHALEAVTQRLSAVISQGSFGQCIYGLACASCRGGLCGELHRFVTPSGRSVAGINEKLSAATASKSRLRSAAMRQRARPVEREQGTCAATPTGRSTSGTGRSPA